MSESEANKVENNDQPHETPIASSEPITKKDPKKVEQGKRLAAISREAKERKLRQKIEDEIKQNSIDYSKYLIPALSSLGVFTFFYLWGMRSSRNNQVPQVSQNETQVEKSEATPVMKKAKQNRFESFVE